MLPPKKRPPSKRTLKEQKKVTNVPETPNYKKSAAILREEAKAKAKQEKIVQEWIKERYDLWLDLLGQKEEWKELRPEKVILAIWMATPSMHRETNQVGLAAKMGISENTLSSWKSDNAVDSLRKELLMNYWKEQTPDVVQNLATAAQTVDENGKAQVPAIKLWLEYIEKFTGDEERESVPTVIVQFGGGVAASPFVNADNPEMQKMLEENKIPESQRQKQKPIK